MDRSDWTSEATCASIGTDWFYPIGVDYVAQAKAFCTGCPVRAYCRIAGIGERWGVWGGLDEKDRDRLRRDARTPIPYNGEAAHARDMRLLSDRAWFRRDPFGTLSDSFGNSAAAVWLEGVTIDAGEIRTA